MQHSRPWVLAIYMSCYDEEIAQDHEPHIITNIQLLVIEKNITLCDCDTDVYN